MISSYMSTYPNILHLKMRVSIEFSYFDQHVNCFIFTFMPWEA